MKIKKITLKNFKKFENLTLVLQPLDCLVGGNNSGKSSLLQSLALFDFCLHQCLTKRNGNPLSLKNRTIFEEDFLVLPMIRAVDLWYEQMLQVKKKRILIEIEVVFEHEKVVKTTIDFHLNRFLLSTQTELDENWLNQLKNFKISYLPAFSNLQIKEEKRTQLSIRNELGRGNVNAVIRNLLLALKEENRESVLENLLRRCFPSIESFKIEFDEGSMQYIMVSYKEANHQKEFDIFSAGSGFQQFIYLFGFILLEQPDIILLDEPDCFLHGHLQKALYNELARLVEDGKQILFATHSGDLIGCMEPENIIYLDDGKAERLRLDYQVFNTLDALGSMENMQLVVLQQFRRVLIMEERDDWDYLQIFGNALIGERKMQEIIKRLSVAYTYGNPCYKDMASFRKSLNTLFTQKGATVKMFVIADRDYFPYPKDLIKQLKQKDLNIEWHIWEQNEIENYLLNETILMRCLKPKSPASTAIDETIFKTKLTNLVQDQKDDIEGRFLKGFETYSRKFEKRWDSSQALKEAKKFLRQEWSMNAYAWADAKQIYGNLSGWLQKNAYEQVSTKKSLSKLEPQDLPVEILQLVQQLAHFVGVSL
jgi:predicted ATPase